VRRTAHSRRPQGELDLIDGGSQSTPVPDLPGRRWAAGTPAQLVALQRLAGNAAVADTMRSVQREPEPDSDSDSDEDSMSFSETPDEDSMSFSETPDEDPAPPAPSPPPPQMPGDDRPMPARKRKRDEYEQPVDLADEASDADEMVLEEASPAGGRPVLSHLDVSAGDDEEDDDSGDDYAPPEQKRRRLIGDSTKLGRARFHFPPGRVRQVTLPDWRKGYEAQHVIPAGVAVELDMVTSDIDGAWNGMMLPAGRAATRSAEKPAAYKTGVGEKFQRLPRHIAPGQMFHATYSAAVKRLATAYRRLLGLPRWTQEAQELLAAFVRRKTKELSGTQSIDDLEFAPGACHQIDKPPPPGPGPGPGGGGTSIGVG
jgi:hypothetical protein